MPKRAYERAAWLEKLDAGGELSPKQQDKYSVILQANEILEEYEQQGYQLTLRQLYYQFVSRALIPNNDKEYKRLGSIVSEGRMLGLIDWNHLVDRGRNFEQRGHWNNPAEVISTYSHYFNLDRWRNSSHRVEVWVEKQALEDVIARSCRPFDVGYIACKGYMSQSEMWAAAERLIEFESEGQTTHILHLGDHDPSGIDMTRDIQYRLTLFGSRVEVNRIALNMDQIEEHDPPPNPAKVTDSRASDYISKYGVHSWELDALEPEVITNLIQDNIKDFLDSRYYETTEKEKEGQSILGKVSDRWEEVSQLIQDEEY